MYVPPGQFNYTAKITYEIKLILGAWLFTRTQAESIEDVLTGSENCSILLNIEKQGESLAFTNNNDGFYTTSEGKHPPIYYYKFKGNKR